MATFKLGTPATVCPTAEACRARGGGAAPVRIGYIHGEIVHESVTYPLVGTWPHDPDWKPHTGEEDCDCLVFDIKTIRLSHPPHNG